MRYSDFMKITEILRLKEMGYFTYREIGTSVGCSKMQKSSTFFSGMVSSFFYPR